MSGTKMTSTGHAVADTHWLDHHFQSARPEYEDSLRKVGVKSGWTMLDAGCGGGNFLPLMCELVGPQGSVVALDLAPENVAHVEALACDGAYPPTVQARLGSILSLPFDNATFDCVWSANVMQYLTESEFDCAIAEFKRVLKPAGTLAIKEFDSTILQFQPMDPAIVARLVSARRAKSGETGVLGTWSGTSMASRLRRAGLTEIWRKGWLVERWAPLSPHTRIFFEEVLTYFAGLAAQHDVPFADLQLWRDFASNPGSLLDDPDFCGREFFVLTLGRVVK
jgi:ubiquinone/menaquinone biosynthesis C-methylase UbiE